MISKSVAILRYLCRQYPVADHWYPADPQRQARVDEYMAWQHNNTRLQCAMYFQTKFLIPMMSGQPVDERRAARFQAGMERALDHLEAVWLRDSPYVAGPQLSVADLLAVCELEQPIMVNYDVAAGRPRLAAWMERVRSDCHPVYAEVHQVCYKTRAKFGGVPKL
ncbi:Glutathione S-transferase theta-1 [Amphibalanus amphitrite]|uniref:glutathione transferase n=1 Tax=Amphibalanus amphitrite TaxID=1232801 RepID=A0A6A4VTF6_AMPAM|nr:Glutathione S-transferase theta-1 [Amphibalanus amphitrite]KAF0298476.1 Glutathione S-transferase theta-1 [Amphibalanus amphitrite]